ncbi:MAG: MIP/aquaporin family protein [Prolixibacteraceae bacterium]|jgi:glycerol uptake facilitator protein
MNPILAEYLGTFILILMGSGVCANSALNDTFAKGADWVLISFGWGLGVYLGVIIAGPSSGAHLNPAVTIGLAVAGKFAWADAPLYILAQFLGAMSGAFLTWLLYSDHYNRTENAGTIKGTFCTAPAIQNLPKNVLSEVVGTFVLIFVVLFIAGPEFKLAGIVDIKIGLGSVGALPVALLVVAIGMSLGGLTGYAINPARDLGPRIIHALVPIKYKGSSDWGYAWVPVVGPVLGATLAALLYLAVI